MDNEVLTPLEPGTHFDGGRKLQFTAPDGFETYSWKVDGNEEYDSRILTVDTSDWTSGIYVVYLEAKDKLENYYSYTAQIKIGE